jgi:HK97 family phage prohead protease
MTIAEKTAEKIKHAKLQAAPINFRALSVTANGVLNDSVKSDFDNRIIRGYAIIWNNRNSYGEKVIKGAATKSINDKGPGSNAKFKLTFRWQHDRTDPLSLFASLVEDDIGLRFETEPLDDVPNADRTIKQLRSGTLNQYSVGFRYVWDKIYYDENDDSLVLTEIDLSEISVVTEASDDETFTLRSDVSYEDQLISFNDEIDDFIFTIPRQHQLELRMLIARQKSLLENKPLELRHKALGIKKPVPPLDVYQQLLNNPKIF